MSTARWAIAGTIAGVLLGVVFFAPAAWLGSALSAATADKLQLAQARGTVWNGSARLVLAGGAGSTEAQALPGRVAWELYPHYQGVQLRLRADCCAAEPLQFTLTPGWRGSTLRVANGSFQWPAAVLTGLGAPWNTLQLQGMLQLSSQGLSVEWSEGRLQLAGLAKLDAIGMSSSLSTLKPLGSYSLRLTGGPAQAPAALQLETLEGSLNLSGSGGWNGSRWSFRGEASALPDSEPALGNLLNMVGRRQGAKSVISLG